MIAVIIQEPIVSVSSEFGKINFAGICFILSSVERQTTRSGLT